MPPHRGNIPADYRTAEATRSPEFSVVPNGLQQDWEHALSGLFRRNAGQPGHLLSCSEQDRQQRRCECAPRVVYVLLLLTDCEWLSPEATDDAPRESHCFRIAFNGERNSRKRWPRSSHKGHERMYRRDRSALGAKRLQYIAAEDPTGVQHHSSMSVELIRQRCRDLCDCTVGHANPQNARFYPYHPRKHPRSNFVGYLSGTRE